MDKNESFVGESIKKVTLSDIKAHGIIEDIKVIRVEKDAYIVSCKNCASAINLNDILTMHLTIKKGMFL